MTVTSSVKEVTVISIIPWVDKKYCVLKYKHNEIHVIITYTASQNIKGKVIPFHAKMAYRRSSSIAPAIVNLRTRWR
jgi:hypothetical protein